MTREARQVFTIWDRLMVRGSGISGKTVSMTTNTPQDPIGALEALGLPTYEAKVFVALQKLGTGTAKEVSEVADVPRSQVYGTTEALEERGLIEIQQSTPKAYRPVSLEEARQRLEARFEETSDRAFSYLEAVQDDQAGRDEAQEGVWRLDGLASIENRTGDLIDGATERVVFGANADVEFSTSVVDHLEGHADDDVDVVVLTEDPERVPEIAGATVLLIPPSLRGSDQAGRMLIVDDDTVLLSVLEEDGSETAIWSARSGFARVLVPLIEDAALGHESDSAHQE